MNKKIKFTKIDFILIILILLFVTFFIWKANEELAYKWDWKSIPQFFYQINNGKFNLNILSIGLITTIKLSIWSILLATLFGSVFGLMKTSSRLYFKLLSSSYVSFFRNTPPIVLIFIFYFFVADQIMSAMDIEGFINQLNPQLIKIMEILFAKTENFSSFIAAILTLGLYEGAYISEIIRSGIESIDKGQLDAALALGLNKFYQIRYIIFPQSLKLILPPLGGQFISTIKDSAIVSVIAIPELTFQGMELMASTYMTFEVWITVTIIYFIICYSCSILFKNLENRYNNY